MKFADVIVPLPLEGHFTYSIPESMEQRIAVGKRVVVEFGARRKYSAIVAKIHNHAPAENIVVKPVCEVVDDLPSVMPAQLALWNWIAGYYMCSEGDVMAAAMPSGMKLASESIISPNADFNAATPLTPLEQNVVDILESEGKMSIAALESRTQRHNIIATVRTLYDKGAVMTSEVVSAKYKPRQETRVELSPEYFNEKKLDTLRRTLAKAKPQLNLLELYISMSSALAAIRLKNRNILRPVTQAALLKTAGCSQSPLKTLQKNGILLTMKTDISRLKSSGAACMPPQPLSEHQQQAYNAITASFAQKDVCLLHGVTSSGKTEIYIHLIKKVLASGRNVLYLLPEIALTTQITTRLRLYFGNDMGVYHSRFPDSERVEIWKKQMSSQPYRIIVGARSSLLLPHRDLGLVIVDEEHEPSYKQEEPAPRYNARDTAIVLATMQGAKTLLGTATPSLESYANACTGKYSLVTLNKRFGNVNLPDIRVEDTKELRRKKMMCSSLSPALIEEIQKSLESGQQTILFQNRRGYSSYIECADCGWIAKCEKCDVSLTYHKSMRMLSCHYCGATYRLPDKCPKCGGTHTSFHGIGTEQVEADVKKIFPQARTARLDLDTTRGRTAYDDILSAFRNGTTDILIGTQMVSKGLDFDRVKVVGILNADTALNMPDFRSCERAFQMMSQVAGRAGRRNTRGIVILQTSMPDSRLVGQIVANDYAGMYTDQMEERKSFLFPPYCRLINIYIKSRWSERADNAAKAFAEKLAPVFGDNLLGPASPPVSRIKLEYIRQIMLKVPLSAKPMDVRKTLRETASAIRGKFRVNIFFDVDPM